MRELHHVTSLGITAIAMGCNSLTELDLKQCYSIDDVAMCALAQYSPNIRQVKISRLKLLAFNLGSRRRGFWLDFSRLQINISYCPVTAAGLWKLLGNLRCLQDAKMVHLTKVSVEGFELSLRASCGRLKKLKLIKALKDHFSPGLLQMLQARGCRLRWVGKPLKPLIVRQWDEESQISMFVRDIDCMVREQAVDKHRNVLWSWESFFVLAIAVAVANVGRLATDCNRLLFIAGYWNPVVWLLLNFEKLAARNSIVLISWVPDSCTTCWCTFYTCKCCEGRCLSVWPGQS